MMNPHMKFQDSSFNGLKVTVGTKSVTHPRTNARTLQKQYAPSTFQSWGHNYDGQDSPMLHTKFGENRPTVLEKTFQGFLPYMGILVM